MRSAPSRTSRPVRAGRRDRRNGGWRWWAIGGAVIAVAVVALVVAAAKGSSGGSPGGAGTDGVAAPRVDLVALGSGTGQVGSQAPQFTATTVDGGTVRVPSGKPTVVYFMAGWCTSCIPEAVALGHVADRLGDRVSIIAVDADPADSPNQLRTFIATVGNPRYAFVRDDSGKLVQAFADQALDTTVVVDATGRITARAGAALDERGLLDVLRTAGLS